MAKKVSIFHKFGLILRIFKGESLKILKRKLRILKKLARLEIFLKYASNILKFKNFPKHGEARSRLRIFFVFL